MNYAIDKLFFYKWFAVILAILGAKIWLINHFGSSVPFWDQWDAEAAGVFLPWLDSTLTLENLFAQHNEHRILFTRLLALGLWLLNDRQWDPLLEMVSNTIIYLFNIGLFILIVKHLMGKAAIDNPAFLGIILLLGIVPYAWENTLAGFHSCWYLMVSFSLVALWGLLSQNNFGYLWWIGLISGMFAFLNLVSGFLVFLAIIFVKLYLFIIDGGNRRSHLPSLLGSALLLGICITLFTPMVHHSSLATHQFKEFGLALGKGLAWPWVDYPWLSLFIYSPFLIFLIKILWKRQKLTHGKLFTLGLGCWVILQAISFAYGRGANGNGPALRYMDVLAFSTLANFLALHSIIQTDNQIAKKVIKGFGCLWVIIWAMGLYQLTLNLSWTAIQAKPLINSEQLKNTRDFLLTADINSLKDKSLLHIPYPHPERLATLLSNPLLRHILPVSLATPPFIKPDLAASAIQKFLQANNLKTPTFVTNGFYPTTGKYQNEETLGSYNHLGNPATGKFTSEWIKISQAFVEIPVAGYLGEKELRLELLIEGQTAPITVTPPTLPRETWVSILIHTGGRPFQIIATDQRNDLWFAFAMPRGIGKLSVITQQILTKGEILFWSGIILLAFLVCYSSRCFEFNNWGYKGK